MIESKSTKYDRVRQSPKIVRLPTSTMFVKCLRLKMWIPVVLSITSYLICLVHVVQRYVAMLTARTLQKYSHWIPQKLVNISTWCRINFFRWHTSACILLNWPRFRWKFLLWYWWNWIGRIFCVLGKWVLAPQKVLTCQLITSDM